MNLWNENPKKLVELYFDLVNQVDKQKAVDFAELVSKSDRTKEEIIRLIKDAWEKLPASKFNSLGNFEYKCSGDCGTCRHKNSHLRNEYGKWIDTLSNWQLFATLTFDTKKCTGYNQDNSWNMIGEVFATNAFYNFIKYLEEYYAQAYDNKYIRDIHTIEYVAGLEKQLRGDYHIHALISGVDVENVFNLIQHKKFWDTEYGFSKFVLYNRNKGAKYYICKYLVKEGDLLIKLISDNTRNVKIKDDKLAIDDNITELKYNNGKKDMC